MRHFRRGRRQSGRGGSALPRKSQFSRNKASWTPLQVSPSLSQSPRRKGRSSAVASRGLGLMDAVRLARLLFGGASSLPCTGTLFERGNLHVLDVNTDGRLELTDPLQMFNFIFLQGAPPGGDLGCQTVVGCDDICPGGGDGQ